MAAAYASRHLDSLNGLVLLAAYPTKSLKSDSFSVLSIYGSEDGVLNMEKVAEGKSQMPADYTEICIEGGNHAQFGNYGEQDHTAGISREEQQKQTGDAILDLMEAHRDQKQEETVMTYEQISVQEAKERMDNEEDVVILDVRTQEEYDSGHIKNAVCLPNEDIISEPDILPEWEPEQTGGAKACGYGIRKCPRIRRDSGLAVSRADRIIWRGENDD